MAVVNIYGGIEGGATNSRIVLVDGSGRCLGFAEGPPTNQWLIGIPETIKRLCALVDSALIDAQLPPQTPIAHLGLALSGVDTEDTRNQLITKICSARPNLLERIHICNDTIGSFLTITNDPAIILIAGTGSICKFVRSDLSYKRIGGYGSMLGDGGGAYYISHYVISKLLEIEDGLIWWHHNIEKVKTIVYEFFGIENSLGLLPHFYEHFDKGNIAKLCERLSVAAREGEPLCEQAFHEAGIQLGRHVRACLRFAVKELDQNSHELLVVCCGNVFRSWDLLRSGFREALGGSTLFFSWSGMLKLMWLQTTAAYGAARFAARSGAGLHIPLPTEASILLDQVVIENV